MTVVPSGATSSGSGATDMLTISERAELNELRKELYGLQRFYRRDAAYLHDLEAQIDDLRRTVDRYHDRARKAEAALRAAQADIRSLSELTAYA